MTKNSMRSEHKSTASEFDLKHKRIYCYLQNHSGSAKVKTYSRRYDRRHKRDTIEWELANY